MGHIKEYDGLRGLMALWVLLGHWTTAIYFQIKGVPANLSNGDAVDVFIVLSGFAIASLQDRRKEDYIPYLTRRIFRIFPVYWFYLLLSVLLANIALDVWSEADGGARQERRTEIAASAIEYYWINILTHLPAMHSIVPRKLIPDGEFAFLGQAWSISLEWQFYVIAPFAISILLRAPRKFSDALKVIGTLLLLKELSRHLPSGFIGNHAIKFALGIGTYYLLKWHARSPVSEATVVSVAALIVAALILLRVPSQLPLAIWVLSTAAVMTSRNSPFGFISKTLACAPIVILGKMSYSIYLAHMIPLVLGMHILRNLEIDTPAPHAAALLAITLGGTFALAAVSYNLIEVPFQHLGKRLANRHPHFNRNGEPSVPQLMDSK